MAEGDGLLNRYTGSNPYRGFESLLLRFRFHFLTREGSSAGRISDFAPTVLPLARTVSNSGSNVSEFCALERKKGASEFWMSLFPFFSCLIGFDRIIFAVELGMELPY